MTKNELHETQKLVNNILEQDQNNVSNSHTNASHGNNLNSEEEIAKKYKQFKSNILSLKQKITEITLNKEIILKETDE